MKWPVELITPGGIFCRIRIPKRRGGYRLVYQTTSPRARLFLNAAHLLLARHTVLPLLVEQKLWEVVHGFVPSKSPATCADRHVGYQRTVAMDLQDFFPSCSFQKFRSAYHENQTVRESVARIHSLAYQLELPEYLKTPDWDLRHTLGLLFPDGAAQQGLPTSPDLANLTAFPLDREILSELKRHRLAPPNCVYTRYADDLTVSHDGDAAGTETVISLVRRAVARQGFQLNESKTQRYWIGAGSRVVVGVSIAEPDRRSRRLRPCRATRRRFHTARRTLSRLSNALADSTAEPLNTLDQVMRELDQWSKRVQGMRRWEDYLRLYVNPFAGHDRRPRPPRCDPPQPAKRFVEQSPEDAEDPLDIRPPPLTSRKLG